MPVNVFLQERVYFPVICFSTVVYLIFNVINTSKKTRAMLAMEMASFFSMTCYVILSRFTLLEECKICY
jgi:hypothetical protein